MIAKHKVVLLSMPWANIRQPSLALGILASICHEKSIPVKTFYPNMKLSAAIGIENAHTLAKERVLFGLSEHLFACHLFDPKTLRSDEFIEAFSRQNHPPFNDAAFIKRIRDQILPAFLDDVLKRVLEENPTVVGFTATFNQVMASLALARRLKGVRRDIQILAGGACFDGEMGREYHRALPGILDHVFMGEAEDSFREYLNRMVSGKPATGIPGVTDFLGGGVQLTAAQPLADMNQSPMPDYEDYFLEKDVMLRETGKGFYIEYLPFESSRGCWWGQKSHCVFCGLNNDLMRFREKDVDRVVKELVFLSSKHRALDFAATDWIISRKSREMIFKKLSELDLGIGCFYETRSDMSKEEIALMRDAGVRTVQPGIESFSTEVLHLMKKGTSRIRQVQFVRWCKEYGIRLEYNLLCGFPGDQAKWYADMAEFLPKIAHLQPPSFNINQIELHRFSPLFEKRTEFGISDFELRKDYRWNFPSGLVDPNKVGYFFDFQCSKIAPMDQYLNEIKNAISRWIEAHSSQHPPTYFYVLGPGFVKVIDKRQGEGGFFDLEGLHRDVFLLADKMQSIASLKKLLGPNYPAIAENALEEAIKEAVEEMVAEDILMQEGELVLALPIGYEPRTTDQLYSHVLNSSPEGIIPAYGESLIPA